MTYTCPLCGQQHDTTACPTHSLSIQQRFGISAPTGTTCNGCCHEQLAARDAEIAELRHKVRVLEHNNKENLAELRSPEWVGMRQRAERAEAQVAELRKDAERYRWLRNESMHHDLLPGVVEFDAAGDPLSGTMLTGRHLDSAIDAAIKESE